MKLPQIASLLAILRLAGPACASATGPAFAGPALAAIPLEFIFFAAILAGVALFHDSTLRTALVGAFGLALYKIFFSPFKTGAGLTGFGLHLGAEWVILANLFMLLLGFALLARHFEESA